jgi:hypothetical protein
MPTLLVHLEYALLFCLVFALGSFIWDLDHFQRCSVKNVVAAAQTDNKDPAYNEENASKGGCRGFTHTFAFGIAFTALYIAFVIHMLMDNGIFNI